jgi:Hemerythrin HHE cation binding domain
LRSVDPLDRGMGRSRVRSYGHDMTTAQRQPVRDDLFTHIHKGLRLGLFELTVETGRVDWNDAQAVVALGERWQDLYDLLRVHTEHEDNHILRLLDTKDPMAAEPAGDAHRDLDDLLGDLDERFATILADPDATRGLELYRDLNRFVAAYLPHLHDEETRIMARIWDVCSDDEIAACRAAFMADTTPSVTATSLRYLLPAIDQPTRLALAQNIAAAPEPVRAGVAAIAEKVLDADDAGPLRDLLLAS